MNFRCLFIVCITISSFACSSENEESAVSDVAIKSEDKPIYVKLDLLIGENGKVLEIERAQGNNNPMSVSPFVLHTLKSETFPVKKNPDGQAIQYWIRDHEVIAGHTRPAKDASLEIKNPA